MKSLQTERVSVLRHAKTNVNGVMTVDWTPVYGSVRCRIDLLHRDVRIQPFLTSEAGKLPDRQGSVFFDARWKIKSGDRLRVIKGLVEGLFEVENTPEPATGFSVSHMEAYVRAITTS